VHVPRALASTLRAMEPVVRPITAAEAFDSPAFVALCDEYRGEALRNPHLRGAAPDRKTYEALISAGLLYPLGVFVGGALVGLCAVLVTPVPHYARRLIASTETLFVAQAHRASGAGLKLLRAAEQVARDNGVDGLYVTAPSGGRLERILPHAGYAETNRVFFRELAE